MDFSLSARAFRRGTATLLYCAPLRVHPKFLIADEISTMLDAITQVQIWEFLLSYCEENKESDWYWLRTLRHSKIVLATRVVSLTPRNFVSMRCSLLAAPYRYIPLRAAKGINCRAIIVWLCGGGAMLFNVSFGWQQECLGGILFLEGYSRRGVLVLGCLVKGNLQGNDALWAEAIPLILDASFPFGGCFSTGRTNRHGDLLLGYYVRAQ